MNEPTYEVWKLLKEEMGDAIEDCSLLEAVTLLVSQRENARNAHAATQEDLATAIEDSNRSRQIIYKMVEHLNPMERESNIECAERVAGECKWLRRAAKMRHQKLRELGYTGVPIVPPNVLTGIYGSGEEVK